MPVEPHRGPAGQHARRGKGRDDERSTAFLRFTPGSLRGDGHGPDAGGWGSIHRLLAPHAEQEGLMMLYLPSLTGTDCMATSCPPAGQKHEPENILKTKARKRAFSKNEAENVLKTSQLQ